MHHSFEIAKDLLSIEAIQINMKNYFTWTSGLKSPIYCDNRLTISYPTVRKKISKGFQKFLTEMDEQPDVIVGCATAGIPHAAFLAEVLDLPLVYVRSSAKEHGKKNQIEGVVKKGQKAIVIEDLISTGGSVLNVVDVLANEGIQVLGVFAIFSYLLERSIQAFQERNIPCYTLTNFDDLLILLLSEHCISEKESEELIKWRDQL